VSRRLEVLLAGALLSALVVFAFLPTLGHGWAPIDDGLNFTRNEHYRGLSWDNLRWMWTTRLAGHYIPLSWMTLGADFLVYGMNPAGYHRTNLLLHLANALLFFGLARRFRCLKSAVRADRRAAQRDGVSLRRSPPPPSLHHCVESVVHRASRPALRPFLPARGARLFRLSAAKAEAAGSSMLRAHASPPLSCPRALRPAPGSVAFDAGLLAG
jgi:hypothetical protein